MLLIAYTESYDKDETLKTEQSKHNKQLENENAFNKSGFEKNVL